VVINLDFEKNKGTHWVCYKKIGKFILYFDSIGNYRPPLDLKKYFKGCDIEYNYVREQVYNNFNCGHLCLKFLTAKRKEFYYLLFIIKISAVASCDMLSQTFLMSGQSSELEFNFSHP